MLWPKLPLLKLLFSVVIGVLLADLARAWPFIAVWTLVFFTACIFLLILRRSKRSVLKSLFLHFTFWQNSILTRNGSWKWIVIMEDIIIIIISLPGIIQDNYGILLSLVHSGKSESKKNTLLSGRFICLFEILIKRIMLSCFWCS